MMTKDEALEEIRGRLVKLEKQYRRLKQVGAAALVIAAALGLMAATRPVPQKITAHEFDVVDTTGKVRIRLSTTPSGASVKVFDLQGNRAASMEVYYPAGVSFVTAGKDGGDIATLDAGLGASIGVAYSPVWNPAALKSGKALRDSLARLESEPSVGMKISPSGEPSITLQDAQGYRMDLGSTSTVIPTTGQTQQTSADSITMFGKDKKHRVIWKAP